MSCFNLAANVPECTETIKVNAHLQPNTEYTTVITGDNYKEYLRLYTTDSDGSISISTSLYPAGYFNRHRGFYIFQVADPASNCFTQKMTVCEESIERLVFNVVAQNPVPEIFEIG